MEAYRLYRTVPAMVSFVDKLTNWYIRRSRRRFWKSEDDGDKAAAYATLYQVCGFSAKLGSLFCLYNGEHLSESGSFTRCAGAWQRALCGDAAGQRDDADAQLEAQWNWRRAPLCLGARCALNILKTRQPLRRLFLLPPDDSARRDLQEMVPLLADELNIKEVVLVEDDAEFSEVSYRNFRHSGRVLASA